MRLQQVSHVIVDEVHERNIDTDFLLSILRDLLPKRPDLRLILMSATMNSSLFVNYFSYVRILQDAIRGSLTHSFICFATFLTPSILLMW